MSIGLHQQLVQALEADGFLSGDLNSSKNWSQVDFTTTYNASSGDRVAYSYRKANQIPKQFFKSQEALAHHGVPEERGNRALVILDDYSGSGTQFVSEALAQDATDDQTQNHHLLDLVREYGQVYLLTIANNQRTETLFHLIETGKIDEAQELLASKFSKVGSDHGYLERLRSVLELLHQKPLHRIVGQVEGGITADGNPAPDETGAFLDKYNVYKYPRGVFDLEGHTVFDYSVPNSLPDLFWNPKSSQINPDTGEKLTPSAPWTPLFQRVEDVSAYYFVRNAEKELPIPLQVYGYTTPPPSLMYFA